MNHNMTRTQRLVLSQIKIHGEVAANKRRTINKLLQQRLICKVRTSPANPLVILASINPLPELLQENTFANKREFDKFLGKHRKHFTKADNETYVCTLGAYRVKHMPASGKVKFDLIWN